MDRPVQGDPSIDHESTQAIGLRDESDTPATLGAVMVIMLLLLAAGQWSTMAKRTCRPTKLVRRVVNVLPSVLAGKDADQSMLPLVVLYL